MAGGSSGLFSKMKTHLTTFLACCILAAASAAAAADAKPNVIIIRTDDQGFGELGATGHPLVRTPHLDRFAAQAVSLVDPAAKLERDAVFFHCPHYYETTTPVSAIRARDWKLLETLEDHRVELFNLRDDPGEKTDLARQQPGKAAGLLARLHAWREEVGAAMPTVNPNFKGKR